MSDPIPHYLGPIVSPTDNPFVGRGIGSPDKRFVRGVTAALDVDWNLEGGDTAGPKVVDDRVDANVAQTLAPAG